MSLALGAVNNLITFCGELHGGKVGAPIVLDDGTRLGDALNRACVALLSAALQAYVEDVFLACSQKAFGKELVDPELKAYKKTWNRWGNPNPDNIKALFLRLGVIDVLEGLAWQRQSTDALRKNLDTLNQVRNRIAHGQQIAINGAPYNLRLEQIRRWRNVCEQFGQRFETHAINKIDRV